MSVLRAFPGSSPFATLQHCIDWTQYAVSVFVCVLRAFPGSSYFATLQHETDWTQCAVSVFACVCVCRELSPDLLTSPRYANPMTNEFWLRCCLLSVFFFSKAIFYVLVQACSPIQSFFFQAYFSPWVKAFLSVLMFIGNMWSHLYCHYSVIPGKHSSRQSNIQ